MSAAEAIARSCVSKHRYPDKRSARVAVKQLKRKGGFARFYGCRHCLGFHTTSKRRNRALWEAESGSPTPSPTERSS